MMPDGSRDGRALVFVRLKLGHYTDLWHLVGDAPRVLLSTRHAEDEPALSPDATLLAFVSNETGQPEVFLQAYPDPGVKIQVSSDGGRYPRWSPTGDRIYYRSGTAGPDGITGVMQVSVEHRSGLTLGTPRAVTIPGGIETYPGGFDVTPDGSRLIVVQSAGGGTEPSLVVMQNWISPTHR
jgi:Tol biopolymer transport system component